MKNEQEKAGFWHKFMSLLIFYLDDLSVLTGVLLVTVGVALVFSVSIAVIVFGVFLILNGAADTYSTKNQRKGD